jgi:hypothetical protein
MNKQVVSISFIPEDGIDMLLRNMDDLALCLPSPYLTVSTEYCLLNVMKFHDTSWDVYVVLMLCARMCVCALLLLRDDLLIVSGEWKAREEVLSMWHHWSLT